MVEQNRDCYGLNRCLEVLRVAKSSWHYRQNGYGRPRAKEEEIEREMRQILEGHPDYGRLSMTKVYPPTRHQGNSPTLGVIIISFLSGFVGFGVTIATVQNPTLRVVA